MIRLQPWGLVGRRQFGLDGVSGGWLPVVRRARAEGGPVGRVGLLDAAAGVVEDAAEALLTLGGGGVLAGSALNHPGFVGGSDSARRLQHACSEEV